MSQVESLCVVKFTAFVTLFGHCPARCRFAFGYYPDIKSCIPGQGVNLYIAQRSQSFIWLLTNINIVVQDTDIFF